MIGAVLVVGGGISGLQSSLDLADSGFKVYLMDSRPSIGGVMAQLDKTFPTNDCAMCIMAPKLVAAGRHHNIHLITNAEIQKIEGDAGNFKITYVKNPRRIDPSKCTGCGVCAQKCPVEAIDEYNEGFMKRGAIYVSYPQAVPLTYAIDKNMCVGCGICKGECRAGAVIYDEQEKTEQIEVGSIILSPGFDEFNPVIKKEYGYKIYRNVVTSIEFERLLSASGPHAGLVCRPSDGEIPRKVAFIQCVGSRDENSEPYCSSVCCMYGVKEAVIAQEHVPGLKASIFFMDMRAFGKEFDYYYERAEKEHGIKFIRCRIAEVMEVPETKNLIVRYTEGEELKAEEFDMVVLSVGLQAPGAAKALSKKLGIDLNKYNFCATKTFSPLETSRNGIFVSGAFSGPKDIPDSVAQASGAAAKAASVIASERNKLVTVKEYPAEIDVTGKVPRIGAFICYCGINIGGVVNVPEVVEYAKTLPNVVYAEHNLFTCSADTQKRIREMIKEHNLNRVVVASCTPRTHEPLFQETSREAGLNPYLFEMANIRDQCSWIHMREPKLATRKAKDLVRMAVAKARLLEPLARSRLSLNKAALVVGGGLSGMTSALELANQGFEVHLVEKERELGGLLRKIHFILGSEDPMQKLAEIVEKVESHEKIKLYKASTIQNIEGCIGNFTTILSNGTKIAHGVIIVATGAREYKPSEYFYGKDDRVLTQLEFEEKLARGKIDQALSNVVMIQCVGSRNDERGYCSRVCCAEAIKNALKIKERNPSARVYVLYRDIRTYGFKEEYYKLAAEKGVIFIRYSDENKPEVRKNNEALEVTVKDEITLEKIVIYPSLLVLSVATLPNEDNEKIAQLLKVPLSRDKFFLEAHMKLRPVDFATDGIFLCGLAHSPKFIDECISQAAGAAARAATILSKDYVEAEGIIAAVNEEQCSGCGICPPVCEYKAIEIVEDPRRKEKKIARVNEGLCKGCGVCVAACPSGALEQRGFKNVQLLAMIDAAIEVAL